MNPALSADPQHQQFLTFELAGEAYAIEILRVQEIRGWEPVRKLPNTPEFVKGALNLRGAIVPIIDLRERFAMPGKECTPMTVVIILSVRFRDAEELLMGVIADTVSDVLDIDAAHIKPAPNLGTKINTRYMRGMYVRNNGMVMLLDVDKLLNPDEFTFISELQ
jgi:purine-binding chemotaxis protein CheW